MHSGRPQLTVVQPTKTLIQLWQVSSSPRSFCVLLHALDSAFSLLQLPYDEREISCQSQLQRIMKGQVGNEFRWVCVRWWCWRRDLLGRLLTVRQLYQPRSPERRRGCTYRSRLNLARSAFEAVSSSISSKPKSSSPFIDRLMLFCRASDSCA